MTALSKDEGQNLYSGPLPWNLSHDTDRDGVHAILGAPQLSLENRADKYFIDGLVVSCVYENDTMRLSRVKMALPDNMSREMGIHPQSPDPEPVRINPPVPMNSDISSRLLALIGASPSDPAFREALISMGIYALPQTVEELREEEAFDSDTDVEYELAKMSRESHIARVERLGVCLIYMTAEEYAMSYGPVPDGADFVLEQVAFFAAGVQDFLGFKGALPFGLAFDRKLADPLPPELGNLIAERALYECPARLYMPRDQVVNVGYDPDDDSMIHIHVRKQKPFDECFLGKRTGEFSDRSHRSYIAHADCLGQPLKDPKVRSVFEDLGVDPKQWGAARARRKSPDPNWLTGSRCTSGNRNRVPCLRALPISAGATWLRGGMREPCPTAWRSGTRRNRCSGQFPSNPFRPMPATN